MPDSVSTSISTSCCQSTSLLTGRVTTETAIVSIYNRMIGILDMGHMGALVLLDMSAAFDTVDHTI
jgi:hypothetical protein